MNNTCTFDAWVQGSRVIGKTNEHAQLCFRVNFVVLWKILIDNGKNMFRKEGLSILLKRSASKGCNSKIGMLLGPKTDVASLKVHE